MNATLRNTPVLSFSDEYRNTLAMALGLLRELLTRTKKDARQERFCYSIVKKGLVTAGIEAVPQNELLIY